MGRLFGEYIRKKREALLEDDPLYSIRKVAERIRVHHSYLSKIERGEPGSLSEQKIVALAEELDEPPDLLLAMNGRLSRKVAKVALRHPKEFGELLVRLREHCDKVEVDNATACAEALNHINGVLNAEGNALGRHETRSHIAAIVSASDVLLEEQPERSEAIKLLQGIRERAIRLLAPVDEELSLSLFESGVSNFVAEPVDILSVVERVKRDLEPQAKAGGVRVRVRLDGVEMEGGRRVQVSASERLCYSIISNLLRNAVEAAPRGGEVTIRVCGGDACTMEIHNEGMVPVEIQGQFFDKFITAGKPGGIGIGTYAAKRMTEALGGSLDMETDEQSGTSLMLNLPLDH